MDFQIKALKKSAFTHLFTLTDAELGNLNACRETVAVTPGTPCRVSMQDAEVGETVILVNFEHQPQDSPYKARHAVFVREEALDAELGINEVPEVIRTRLMSLRCFDRNHMMIDADVVSGDAVGAALSVAFDDPAIDCIHLHNAKPGCFAASVHRA